MSGKPPFLTRGRSNAFAHQGDSAAHPPGNTWAAFASAVEVGFDHLESDVHVTADGVLVLFHDEELDHRTTGTGLLREKTWQQLEHVRYRDGDEILDEGLVRLDEALARWPDVAWNIDAKSGDAVEPLVALVVERAAEERVLLTSFSFRNLRRLRRLAPPKIATGISMPEVLALRVAAWLRLPFPKLGDAAQVPIDYKNVTVVNSSFIRTCHRAGIEVHTWTINDEFTMRRLLDLGVDAIITDDATLLRTVLIDRDQWDTASG